jgi:V/A-type H+-transporting ATPase subunit E
MNAEPVLEKIISDARAEAEKIKKSAEEKERAEQVKLEKQLAEFRKETNALVQKAARDKKFHILAQARMNNAKQFLAEKRKLLDKLFEQARRQLQSLSDEQYNKLMTRLMLAAVETGDEEVVVGINEKRVDHNFVKQINRELGPGYKGNLRLCGDKDDFESGFVLRRGKIKTNVSIDVLLSQARKDLEIEMAKELFR